MYNSSFLNECFIIYLFFIYISAKFVFCSISTFIYSYFLLLYTLEYSKVQFIFLIDFLLNAWNNDNPNRSDV